MKWPAMTMGFAKPDPKAFADVHPGDTVHFRFKEGGPSGYELVEVRKLATRSRQVIAALIRWSVVNRFLVLIATRS